MHVFNISFFRKYKLYIIISLAIIIAAILMIVSFSSVIKIPEIKLIKNTDIFNCNSYYTEYTITEISNKNTNIYKMKEWYKKISDSEFFKFSYNDSTNNEVQCIIANGKIKIQNLSQMNTYILNEHKVEKNNLFSIITYIDIINNYKDSKCINVNLLEDNEYKKYEIVLVRNLHTSCLEDCKYKELFVDGLKLAKIEFIIKNDLPEQILVINEKNEVYLDIDYNKFNFNEEIPDDIFVF